MKFKLYLLMLCLTTGLSLGVSQRYGYSQTSDPTIPTNTPPQETVSDENSEHNFYILLLLLNIIALLGATGTCAFLVYKNNKINQTNKEDNAFLIKLEPEEDQQTNEQVQAKHELDTNLKRIQESLQEIKDSFIDDSISEVDGKSNGNKVLNFLGKFAIQEKDNRPIGLNNKQYNYLIDLINKLGLLLDDNYIAMLKYNNFSRYDHAIETIKQSIDEYLKTPENREGISNQETQTSKKIEEILQEIKSLIVYQSQPNNSDPFTENERQKFKDKIIELTKERNEYKLKIEENDSQIEQKKIKPHSTYSLTEQERQQFNDRIRYLIKERDNYQQEIQEKNDKIAQIKTGAIERIRQEYDDLFQKYEKQSKDYESLYQYYERYQTLETERENITTEFNKVRQQLQQEIHQKDQKIQQKDNEINQLKVDVERLTAACRRENPQSHQLSSPWQALVNLYMQNPENIKNHATDEVIEDYNKFQERRKNASKPVIFRSDKSDWGYYIISSGNDYLLFPKQHQIPTSQRYTATAVFEGYKSGSTKKFTSIIPAQVKSLNNGMWELKKKGRLEYS